MHTSDGGRGVSAALIDTLDTYVPVTEREAADVERLRLAAVSGDPWTRASLLHATGSAIVVHPASGRVLLRWHERLQSWLQVGGHADNLETDPFQIALREAVEETGLSDLASWPDAQKPLVVQIVIVPVPAGRGEAAHEHADVRYVLATAQPDAARPETAAARLQWLSMNAALALVAEDNLRVCLRRIAARLSHTT